MKDYAKIILKNKLRLVVVPMKDVRSVTALITVGTGSRYEEKRINGLSHFLEHMFFKGTKNRPSAIEISSIIDSIGGEFNAYTDRENTGYFIKAEASKGELLVDMLSDMLQNSLFAQAEIDRERGVIIEELNMYEDDPRRKIADIYEELLYGDHPLGWDVGGSKEIIKKITKRDFLDYMDARYVPNNMVIALAGNISETKARALTEKYMGNMISKPVTGYKKFDEKQNKPQLRVQYKKTDQAHVAVGVRALPLIHKERFPLAVLNTILGVGMSSRLFINVRERRGLAYYVFSHLNRYHDVGNLYAQAGVDLKRIDEAIKVILEEFAKMAKVVVDEKEMTKAKDHIKGRMALEREDTKSVAWAYGLSELLEGRVWTDDDIVANIDKVTAESVLKVAKDVFKPANLNLAVIGPFKEEARFKKLLKL
ncbi:MAG TPA: pitrilysin family protein [Patescibacteria group bacterium]